MHNMLMHPQSEFYYTSGDRVNEETREKMVQLMTDVEELSEVFNDPGSESLGSFWDKAVKKQTAFDEGNQSEMVEMIKDYMHRYSMVSSILIHSDISP